MRKMKYALVILCLLLIASSCYALTYQITLHSIDVRVDADGKASIVEKFYLDFPHQYYKNEFREKSSELGTNLEAWREFDPNIKLSLGSVEEIEAYSGKISFIENESNYLELSYDLREEIMKNIEETSRLIEYDLKIKFLNSFLERPFYLIPEKTVITFLLPREATLKAENITPSAEISEGENYKSVSWEGMKKTTNLQLKYTYWKQLSPILSISKIVKGFIEESKKETQAIITVILVALFAVVYFKREKINKKITSYIIKNTEFIEHEE